MGLMQFPYMCLVGPYEAHTEYIFMGPYIYMHLSYTMGPRRLYRGVREIVTWALPSTMTQICVMGSHKRLRAELKPKFATLVEYMYNFNTSQARASIIYNAIRAQELLRDMNFIYPVRLHHLSR